MSRSRCTPPLVLSCLIAFAAAWLAAITGASAFAQAQPEAAIPNQITQPINPDERVTLQNNVHPLAQARYDQGPAPPSMATGRIMLVLKRSDVQEHALRQYLDELQNPNSANYHKWLTPETMGAQYGINDGDLATVTAWLQGQGFAIDKVSPARNIILFSGNVTQIQQAFSTTIHRYVVNGETHFANATDPQIPAALAPVIAAVAPLNDFRPRAGAIKGGTARYDASTNTVEPDLTLCNANGCNVYALFAAPADAATIYDTPNSVLNGNYSKVSSMLGGKSYDGTGVTIGVAGDANINAQDVANYRAAFLPSGYSSNQPNVIVDGNDPGINGDSTEALLDLEVSGGLAPGAKINFYTSANNGLSSGLILAIFRAIDDNNVGVLNVSFGNCEAALGNSGNELLLNAWEQAAAQGISVTVSTGDSGSAGCDDPNTETQAEFGLAVNGFASTPYDIAVGGTDYNVLVNNFTMYATTTNTATSYYRSALGYIPESPWNDSTSTNTGEFASNQPTMQDGSTNIIGGGGGVSGCTQSTGAPPACDSGYPKPAFQTGAPNFSLGGRGIPDVSFLAANGFYNVTWAVCSDSQINGMTPTPTQMDCEQSNGVFAQGTTFTGVGGTSAAAPAFAGMLALISQSQNGVRLGQVDNVLYNLAAQSSLYSTIFHDVTTGNNSVVCDTGTGVTGNCGSNGFITDYNAGTGFDAASGLGSVDASQLVANWTKASFAATTTSFTINGGTGAISVTHGTQLTLAADVAPGAATGDVSFINNSGVENNQSLVIDFQTLSGGKVSLQTGDLPGSSKPYNVYAYYGGDVKNAASQSNPVQVTISPEASSVILGMSMTDPSTGSPVCNDITQGGFPCKGQTVPYGFETVVSAQVKGASNANTPATGNITMADTAGSLPASTLPISSIGYAAFTNQSNPSLSLSVGSHGLTGTYAGDGSYMASNSGSAYTFKITQGQSTVAIINGGESQSTVTITAQVGTDSVGLAPTGAVTFKAGSATLGTVTTPSSSGYSGPGTIASQYILSIPASTAGLINGANTITASYAGDTNYTASMGSGTVSVTGGGGSGFNINAPATLGVVAGVATANTGIVGVMSQSGFFSGTVALTCAISSGPTVAISAPTCALSPASVSLSGTLIVPSTLTISTTATTTLGAYVVTITGTGGGTTASGTTNLTVSSTNGQGNFSVAGTAVSVMAGATTGNASTVSVTPSGGFLGSVAMKCALSSSPMGAVNLPTCSIPASVLVGGTAAASTMMTVSSTPAMSGALSYPALFKGAGEAALACLVMLAIPARRRAWRSFLGLIALAFAISGVVACGGGGGSHNSGGTTAGSYTFTVTGTASSSGNGGGSSITASSTVQVMIN